MNLFRYVENIKLNDNVLEHLKETELELLTYMEELSHLNDQALDIFLFDAMIKENISSSELENGLYSPSVVNMCQDKLNDNDAKMTEEMIKEVNKCILRDNNSFHDGGIYRNCSAWVGNIDGKFGIENARYIAPPEDKIENLMEQFIDYVNADININPILKSAIIHILFIKIHPFSDGNGRSARILHHHTMTQLINKKYNTKFQWPIINLSKFLDLTRGNYYTCENDIIFDMETDNNESWNKWFNYILNRIDDNLYYYKEDLKNEKERLEEIGKVKIKEKICVNKK
ncbi:MAG: Fic family protein [Bacilli bacterium]|nr:Fic family protein [Bacilli bacterium]